MSHTIRNHDAEQFPVERIDRLVCPNCSSSLPDGSLDCRECAFEGRRRDGVVSLMPSPASHSTTGLDAEKVERLAALAERQPLRDATTEFRDATEDPTAVLSELYDVGRDAWRVFASDHITGRCLDVNAGFGRRAALLAELATDVYAVDPNLSKLRVASARDDYASSERVTPIHTTADRLPFADGSFETVVADLTGSSRAELQEQVARLDDYLAPDGTLIFQASGLPSRLGVSDRFGPSTDGNGSAGSLTAIRDSIRSTPDGYRSLLTDAGLEFDTVSLYTLFPTATRPLFVFDPEDEPAVRKLFEIAFSDRGRLAQLRNQFVSVAHRTGLLDRLYPNFLVVCTNDPEPVEPDFSHPLLIPGRSRSVVLDATDDRVWKLPNRDAHAPLTDRENSVLASLRSSDDPIVETLPEGRAFDSRFGPARAERVVEGASLADELDGSPDSFERVLRLGLEWLTAFQQAFGGAPIVRSPADVREDLRFEPTGVEPPPIDEPVETVLTPVHGDYLPANVHVHEDEVTGVIDWEYSAIEESPIIDAGFFVLDTAMRAVGSFEEGFQAVFCDDTVYARRARPIVRRYCDELGVPYRTFELYLPRVYLHRLELDWRFDATSTYTTKMHDRTDAAEYMIDQIPDVSLE